LCCCAQGSVPMEEHYRKQSTGDGHTLYWLDGRFRHDLVSPNTDQATVRERYVTVTPLRFDLTDAAKLAEISEWDWPGEFR